MKAEWDVDVKVIYMWVDGASPGMVILHEGEG